MIGIFRKKSQIFIVGLDDEGNIMDPGKILSRPNVGIDIDTFDRFEFNPKSGQVIEMNCSNGIHNTLHRIW